MSKIQKSEEINYNKLRSVINRTFALDSHLAYKPQTWTALERIA